MTEQPSGGLFQRVNLFTREGALVTTVSIPKFQLMPEVINWGTRFFVANQDGQYREGMLWVAVN